MLRLPGSGSGSGSESGSGHVACLAAAGVGSFFANEPDSCCQHKMPSPAPAPSSSAAGRLQSSRYLQPISSSFLQRQSGAGTANGGSSPLKINKDYDKMNVLIYVKLPVRVTPQKNWTPGIRIRHEERGKREKGARGSAA